MLGAIIISTLVVVMTIINDLIISILVSRHQILTTFVTFLVKLSWFEFDGAPFCGYPLVSYVVQNVDVNTPLVLCSWIEWMDEYVDFVILINLPTPCLSIYSRP
jgi:hypothetical protein